MPCALQGSDGHLNVCGLEKKKKPYWLKANAMQKTWVASNTTETNSNKPNHHQPTPTKTKMHPGDEVKR